MRSTFHIITSLVLLFVSIIASTAGYYIVEHWSLFDSFYMTIITLGTVGYGEIHPLSHIGRVFTSIMILFNLIIVTYFTASITRILLEGEILNLMGKRKLEQQLNHLTNHYIICGYGRIGKLICEELQQAGRKFVIIENDPQTIARDLEGSKLLYINGNSTLESVLIKAGIERAMGIVTAVASDADNVFITLSARQLNPKIFILSRASDEKAEQKIRMAGASKVVMPYNLGAHRMVSALLRPHVTDFLEITTKFNHETLQLEELFLQEKTPFVGLSLKEANLPNQFGVIIVAIKQNDGQMIFNPKPEQKLTTGSILIVLGRRADLIRLGKVF